MYRQALIAIAFLLVSLAPGGTSAQSLENLVVEHRLANGMTFLLVPRAEAPVFAGVVLVRVGGVDEPEGQTGLAHMFEHMAFKGTPWIGTRDYDAERVLLGRIDSVAVAYTRLFTPIPVEDKDSLLALERRTTQAVVEAGEPEDEIALARTLAAALAETLRTSGTRYPNLERFVRSREQLVRLKQLNAEHRLSIVPDEFSQIVRVNGGVGLNAGTSKDYTIYYEEFPANRLELWALIESQRFMHPVMREFYAERDVIAEERRMRTDDDPSGKLYEQVLATAMAAHPYGVPTIGWMSDIQGLTAEDAVAFRSKYYVPANAVGVLVGDFDVDDAKKVVDRYFGAIPPARGPVPEVRTQEPPQEGERRVEVEFDAEPAVMIGWHKPNYPSPDAYVFSVISMILRDSGPSSRLYKRLVKTGIARDIGVYEETPGQRYPNVYLIEATSVAPHTTAELEAIIYEELDSLARVPVPAMELRKVKNQIEAAYIRGLVDNSGLASQLAHAQGLHGDWRLVATHREIVARVTPEDVMRVASKYFTRQNRTVATLVRAQDAPAGTTTEARSR